MRRRGRYGCVGGLVEGEGEGGCGDDIVVCGGWLWGGGGGGCEGGGKKGRMKCRWIRAEDRGFVGGGLLRVEVELLLCCANWRRYHTILKVFSNRWPSLYRMDFISSIRVVIVHWPSFSSARGNRMAVIIVLWGNQISSLISSAKLWLSRDSPI